MMYTKNRYLPYLMWLLPLIFFAYQFILRLWPGLMLNSIIEQFSIDAAGFGLLAAFYYFGYAGMQIPCAIILERYGVRRILCFFAILCGLANLMFSLTNNFLIALLCRFLIGACSGIGFLSISKIVSEWFPKEQYTRMIGLSFTFGLLGAIYGGKPTNLMIELYGERMVSIALALISILIGICSFIFVRSKNHKKITHSTEQKFEIANFIRLLSSPAIWCLAIINLLMVGVLEGFTDVWGIQFMMIKHKILKGEAAGLVSLVFFGMIFGGPILSALSKRFGNYFVIAGCGFTMAIAFLLILFFPNYNYIFLSILFFVLGIMCCYQVIVFAAGANLVEQKNLSITIAFLNSINME